jgi:hypothetical protein
LGIRKFEIFFLSLFEFLSPELESSPEAWASSINSSADWPFFSHLLEL